jgi:Ser/Thr protein kinase RdoA (MazF antagonist)
MVFLRATRSAGRGRACLPAGLYWVAGAFAGCHPGRVPSETEHRSSAAGVPGAAGAPPWRHEPAVRAAVREHWGLEGEFRPVQATAASRTWQAGRHIVKLARDEPAHFTAGLRASEAIEEAGIVTGAPVRDRAGRLCVPLSRGPRTRVLAVLRRAAGSHLSMHAVAPVVLGELLGRLHRILRGCPVEGAWTPDDVLGHMARGSTAAHPPAVRQMITQAVSHVRAFYATAPPVQMLRGDGPEIFSVNGTDISAIIDWGGARVGSVADDIGCWTAHGATDRIPLPAYTAAFLEGYCRSNELAAAGAAAVPLFQRLRIASRACYVTSHDGLAGVVAWMGRAFGE